MSYGDGLLTIPEDISGVFIPPNGPAGDFRNWVIVFPFTLLALSLFVAEDCDNFVIKPVIFLDYEATGVTRTRLTTVTLDTNLKRSDGTRARITPIATTAAIKDKDVIMWGQAVLPKKFMAGTTLIIGVATASAETFGLTLPGLLIRIDGLDTTSVHILS